MRALRQYQIDCNIIEPSTPENKVQNRGDISQEFAEFLAKDEEFYYSISHNTNYQ